NSQGENMHRYRPMRRTIYGYSAEYPLRNHKLPMFGRVASINSQICKMRFWIILSCWFTLSTILQAQEYRYEIGGAAGTSFYMGDANKNSLFKYPGIAGGLLMRYNISLH